MTFKHRGKGGDVQPEKTPEKKSEKAWMTGLLFCEAKKTAVGCGDVVKRQGCGRAMRLIQVSQEIV
jgi:hypothetical protein